MTDEPKTEPVELSVEQLEDAAGGGDGSVRVLAPSAPNLPSASPGLLLPAVKGGIIAV